MMLGKVKLVRTNTRETISSSYICRAPETDPSLLLCSFMSGRGKIMEDVFLSEDEVGGGG